MPYILMIRERSSSWAGRGPIAVIHPSEEEAQAQLIEYVRGNWDNMMNDDPPEDDYELVEEYFDQVLEEYVITQTAYSTSPANAETSTAR